MTTSPFRSTSIGILLMVAGLTAVQAQSRTELTFSHTLPANHPAHTTGFTMWADSIKEATNGEVSVAFFPAGQMGVGRDHYEMVRDGIVDVAWLNPGHTPGRFPIIAAGEIPFLISDGMRGSKAFDRWYRDYVDAEMGDVHFCLAHTHEPGTIHTRAPVVEPTDLRGMRIRPANATLARLLQANGASSIQVGPSEAREVLARGTADGITFPWRSPFVFGMDEFVKHHVDIPLYATTFVIAINKNRYARLSDAQKQVVDAHCSPDWAQKITTGWSEYDLEGRDILLATAGHTVHVPSPEQADAWRATAAPLKAEWEDAVRAKGLDPDAIFQSLTRELAAEDALF
ncbi:TRAP transporter substrate-binding protein [Azoarcus taiwanensis]|uniref:C4-dicarboxylate ABC transporter n=1 Tax=Azoarcus taiwanensis TaxID=666964 RepID=A0A972F8Z8_9RHOO|nr:TRAP transporter substrate-binding protein [Azoarcus taiwanensis]NMG04438.1 C4-dicarboxylate ABC transporter [Azoarcus taiwanensis]